MERACVIFLLASLATAQLTTPNPLNQPSGTTISPNQKGLPSQAQISPFAYQNTQSGTPLNLANNVNQGNLEPQGQQPLVPQQFNQLLPQQNAQFGAGFNFGQFGLDQFGNNQGNVFGGFQPGAPLPGFDNGGLQGFNPLFGNNFQINAPQGGFPQPVQDPVTKEVRVPQPYPVFVNKPVPVQVPVQVPVEVPKPYPIQVPHPVPVPIQVRVPVPVEKPYPVTITRTVPIPVEKPVYIRIPAILPQGLQQYQNLQQFGLLPAGLQQQINPGTQGQVSFQQQQIFPQEIQIGGRIQTHLSEGREVNQVNTSQLSNPGGQNQGSFAANQGVTAQQRVNTPLLTDEVQSKPLVNTARGLKSLQSNEVRSS